MSYRYRSFLFSRSGWQVIVVLALFSVLGSVCLADTIEQAIDGMSGVYDPARNMEELYGINQADHHIVEYDVQTGATTDLTNVLGVQAYSPSVSAVYVPATQTTYIFFLAYDGSRAGDVSYIRNAKGAYSWVNLSSIYPGVANDYQSVSATYDPSTNSLEAAFQGQTDSAYDGFGTRGVVYELTFNYSQGGPWQVKNMYAAISRTQEHLETQVGNFYNSRYGQMQVSFDPEGEHHIHLLSYVPGGTVDNSQDLMDTTDGDSVNATCGQSQGSTIPDGHVAGYAPLYNSSLGTEELYYLGNDSKLHQLRYDGSWHSLDITSASSSPVPSACSGTISGFGAAYNPYFAKTEVFYIGADSSSPNKFGIKALNGEGGTGWTLVGNFANNTLGYPGTGPEAVIYNSNTRNLDMFFMGYHSGDANVHLFQIAHQSSGAYVKTLLN
jgi:hypothetical protein